MLKNNLNFKKREDETFCKQSLCKFIAENARDMIFVIDRNNSFLYANPYLSDKLGIPLSKIEGKKISEVFSPTFLKEYEQISEDVFKSKRSKSVQVSFPGKDKLRWAETHLIPLKKDGEVNVIMGISRDITEQKENQEELKKNVKKFQTWADLAPAGLYETYSDGNFDYVNKTWMKMFGLSFKKYFGKG